MATTQQFLLDQIASIEAQIIAYQAAVLSFATNGMQQEYKFDSGQETITVERGNLREANAVLNSLINQHDIMCVRAGLQPGAHTARPGY